MKPESYYSGQIDELNIRLASLEKRRNLFGALRLGLVLLLIVFFYFLWNAGWVYVLAGSLIFLAIFLILVKNHLANKELIEHVKRLVEINLSELKFLAGNRKQFYGGDRFKPHEHDYAEDIDILGDYSLFQFLNRCQSEPAEELLAKWLLAPASKEDIQLRQTAVVELSNHLPFLHELRAFGMENKIRDNAVMAGNQWLSQPSLFIGFKHWKWLRYMLPVIAVTVTGLYIAGIVNDPLFYSILILMAVVAYQVNKYVAPVHRQLSAIAEQASTFEKSIREIEKTSFTAPLLKELQTRLLENSEPASKNIGRIKKILDRLDLRYNILISFFLNILLQWNLQQMLDLEKWKTKNHQSFEKWVSTIAQFEALASLATLRFNFPGWVFPEFAEKYFSIEATELGHPFIPAEKRVNNFIDIQSRNEIMIITGSNMAGKSTYLRSLGVNLVLAQAGAPVAAKYFRFYPVQLMTSMRISDNLEESTSTFYAELKKLKNIIKKVKSGEEIFILLDEILRGTNSHDRHAGAEALIKQLVRQQSPAVIATHDIELTGLQKEFPAHISNYHFDVQVSGEELYFDYKLKPGICTSMNASILMKKIGIEI